jgi:hypothetical protein
LIFSLFYLIIGFWNHLSKAWGFWCHISKWRIEKYHDWSVIDW